MLFEYNHIDNFFNRVSASYEYCDDDQYFLDDMIMLDDYQHNSSSPQPIDDSITLEDLTCDDDPHDAFQLIFQRLKLSEESTASSGDQPKQQKEKKIKKTSSTQVRKIKRYDQYLMQEANVSSTFEKIFITQEHVLEIRFIVQSGVLKAHAGDVMSLLINRQNVSREIFVITQPNDTMYKTFINMHWVPIEFITEWISRKRKIKPFLPVYKQLIKFMKTKKN